MREIKFRAWANNIRKMFYEGFDLTHDGHIKATYGIYDKKLTIMQYIGLKDKKGEEIYEGDIVKDTDSKFCGEVVWDEETLCFTTKFQSNELWGFVPRNGRDNHCEVIGNIYENLELLKGQGNG